MKKLNVQIEWPEELLLQRIAQAVERVLCNQYTCYKRKADRTHARRRDFRRLQSWVQLLTAREN